MYAFDSREVECSRLCGPMPNSVFSSMKEDVKDEHEMTADNCSDSTRRYRCRASAPMCKFALFDSLGAWTSARVKSHDGWAVCVAVLNLPCTLWTTTTVE